MNTSAQVDQMLQEWTTPDKGLTKTDVVVKLAYACMGWSYVWGADGQLCTKANRLSFSKRSSCPEAESKVILRKCQQLNTLKKTSCMGCEWYPQGTTRFFDCRGFTRWLLKILGILIQGGGATSQWKDDSNWLEKGEIDKMPRDKICCVFMKDGSKMSHTGLYVLNDKIVHCSGTVKEDTIANKHWTHYAVPKGMDGYPPVCRPTIKRGNRGEVVREAQQLLIGKGYSVGDKGADGIFGRATQSATKAFQKACGIKVDGIIGRDTWTKLYQR